MSEWMFTPDVIQAAREIAIGDRVAVHWVEAECPDQEGTVVGVQIERYGRLSYSVHFDGDISPTDGFYHDRSGHDAGSISLLRALPKGPGEPLTFGYTNWRGEYAERTAIPLRIERKESEWHGPGLHYVMVAFDVEKQAERDFLLTDMGRAAPTEKGADGTTPS